MPRFLAPGLLPEDLTAHGGAPALVGPAVPGGRWSYAELAREVTREAATYGETRQLVLLEAPRTAATVVRLLGAWAAGNPVLLAAPGGGASAESYRPGVVLTAEGRHDRPDGVGELHPDLALLLSTSGSTGSAKLVRLSADNVLANAGQIVESLGIRADDVAATTLPLHYCFGLSLLTSHLAAGASLLLTDESVTSDRFWDQVAEHGVSTFPGVPHTFDLLERSGFAEREAPSLRYLTQAGGRMPPDQVRRLAQLGQRRGFDLVVMYGQTEATARMAVLPADLAHEHPDCVGRAVPGGSFRLAPIPGAGGEGPHAPEVGELVFAGPNVMMGYAEQSHDLARGPTIEELHTGDLARIGPHGLIEITGRCARIAKVLGLRVDLDAADRRLAARGCPVAAVDGGDRVVLGVCSAACPVDPSYVTRLAAEELGVPPSAVVVVPTPDLPRLPSGKVDSAALAAMAAGDPGSAPARHASTADLCVLVGEVFGSEVVPSDSFVSLGGDSLTYVEVSLRLERALGVLPAHWHQTPLAELAQAAEPATVAGDPRPRSGWNTVETNVVLRALAIVAIVGSHANLFALVGGAHVLLAIAGFNAARFHLTVAPRAERVRRLLASTARIAVPSALLIGVVSWWTAGLGWRQAALVNSLSSGTWAEPAWHYWFVEALVQILLAVALLMAVPAFDRADRRWPFYFPMVLTLTALLPRYGIGSPDGDQVHRAVVVFFLFALGWATYRASGWPHRLLVSVVALTAVPGLFGVWEREALVVAGLLALVWIPSVRLPGLLARVVGPLASASLWIYLVHWQVYPWFESRSPLLGTALSLLAGMLAWWMARRMAPWVSAGIAHGRGWFTSRELRSGGRGGNGGERAGAGAAGRDDQPAHLAVGSAGHR